MFLENHTHLTTNRTIKERLEQLDYIGPSLFIPANICLVLALQWGGSTYPWTSPTILGLFSGFAIIIPIWLYSQFRLGEKATIPLRIMTSRTMIYSSIFGFLTTSAFTIPLFYLPFYFQAVRDTTAIASGVDLMPIVVGVIVSSIVSTMLLAIIGYYTLFMITGGALLAVGAGLLGTLSVDTTVGQWIGYQAIVGFGSGMAMQALNRG